MQFCAFEIPTEWKTSSREEKSRHWFVYSSITIAEQDTLVNALVH